MNKTIKIIKFNRGNYNLDKRINQIKEIIEKHKPKIIVINKLNLSKDDIVSQHQFKNYKLITDNLDITDAVSRTGMLIHRDIHYQRRKDLEAQGLSTIWIKLKNPLSKPMLVQGIYCQFQRLNHKGSHTITEQKKRWTRIIEKWEQANNEDRKIISLGDLNLNKLSWEKTPEEMDLYEKAQTPMVQLLKDKILNKRHIVLDNKPTRTKDNIQSKPSCLDLLIMNSRQNCNIPHRNVRI